MLTIRFLHVENARLISTIMARVMTGESSVSFEGGDPAGPAFYTKVRSGRNANSPIYALIDGILWNESLVPIMNQMIPSLHLPFNELVGNIFVRVSLLLDES